MVLTINGSYLIGQKLRDSLYKGVGLASLTSQPVFHGQKLKEEEEEKPSGQTSQVFVSDQIGMQLCVYACLCQLSVGGFVTKDLVWGKFLSRSDQNLMWTT